MNDDIIVEEENKDKFINWVQNFCWLNWEIGLGKEHLSEEERLHLIDKEILEKGLIHSNDLNEVVDENWVRELVEGCDKKDIDFCWHLDSEKVSFIVNKISHRMAADVSQKLVEDGLADLCWDKEKEDFVLILKGGKDDG